MSSLVRPNNKEVMLELKLRLLANRKAIVVIIIVVVESSQSRLFVSSSRGSVVVSDFG
jgi:hypothetical protein